MPNITNNLNNADPLSHPTIPRVKSQFPDQNIKAALFRHQTNLIAPTAIIHDLLLFLRDDPQSRYDMLADLFGIDYLNYPAPPHTPTPTPIPARFAVVYNLLSTTLNHRIFIKTLLTPSLDTTATLDDPALHLPSCCDIWPGAEWNERETFDMFGLHFDNHPDLRRILTYESFPAHPLRKDYPLTGRGERTNFNIINRNST